MKVHVSKFTRVYGVNRSVLVLFCSGLVWLSLNK